jgi:dTDP-4-dehydrorhamnose 3,5-epimerase
MKRFIISQTPLAGLIMLTRQRLLDDRGFLARLFCAEEFAAIGWNKAIAQINHTHTAHQGTVRGLHFQNPPHAEMKLVSCLCGAIWDVAVDIRANSPTFLHWYGVDLSAENCRALLIPEGFAHGFQALSDAAELLYCHSTAYAAGAEGGLHPQDPVLKINWPLPVTHISQRDMSHTFLTQGFTGVQP